MGEIRRSSLMAPNHIMIKPAACTSSKANGMHHRDKLRRNRSTKPMNRRQNESEQYLEDIASEVAELETKPRLLSKVLDKSSKRHNANEESMPQLQLRVIKNISKAERL